MSARFRSRTATATVTGILALGLAGCASEGVIGAAGTPAGAATTAPATGQSATPAPDTTPAASSGGSTTPAAPDSSASASTDPAELADSLKKLNDLWTDPGCKTGLRGFGAYLTAAQESPEKGIAAIPDAIRDLRAGAGASKRPDATHAMNNMVQDLQAMSDAAKAGQTPDKGKLRNDWQIMGNSCVG